VIEKDKASWGKKKKPGEVEVTLSFFPFLSLAHWQLCFQVFHPEPKAKGKRRDQMRLKISVTSYY
jgi:hypothetical protein